MISQNMQYNTYWHWPKQYYCIISSNIKLWILMGIGIRWTYIPTYDEQYKKKFNMFQHLKTSKIKVGIVKASQRVTQTSSTNAKAFPEIKFQVLYNKWTKNNNHEPGIEQIFHLKLLFFLYLTDHARTSIISLPIPITKNPITTHKTRSLHENQQDPIKLANWVHLRSVRSGREETQRSSGTNRTKELLSDAREIHAPALDEKQGKEQ